MPWAEEVIGLSAHLGCQGQGECHTLLICEKSVEIREICGQQLSAQCAKEQAECIILPRISQISTDTMRGAFIKKHGFRCAQMGLFTDCVLLLLCLPLGFDAPPAQWIGTDLSQAEGALRSEKSVEICEICGRQLSAQCAKEQAECFYSPTDRALSTDTMRNAFIKKTRDPPRPAP